jgi:amino acid transporter
MATAETKEVFTKTEKSKLKRELTLLPLLGLIYFTVCGGAFGAEPMVGLSGPGLALLLMVVTPLIFSIPNMLMVREMQSMMPVEGGYYHWTKQAFGRFVGFLAGWMNWVVSWVDVSIYPVWTAWYLSYFIPALSDGATIFGIDFSGSFLSWLVAAVLIIAISLLNIRGARLSGLTSNWLSLLMIIPLVIMSGFGIYAGIKSGQPLQLEFLPCGAEVNGPNLLAALSVGIYVAMWNFMAGNCPPRREMRSRNRKRSIQSHGAGFNRCHSFLLRADHCRTLGGAGADKSYMMWGIEEYNEGEGIGAVLAENGITEEQIIGWGADPATDAGWEFPTIAHRIGDNIAGKDSGLSYFLGAIVGVSAILSMTGLFIGNGLGGTRVPYALAEDGMMPKWLNKVHPKYGTPWVAIALCGLIYMIFATSAFQSLVVIDVFLNMLVLMAEIFALVVLRIKKPDIPRNRVPGGVLGLVYIVVAPLSIIVLAIVSQVIDYGWQGAIGWSLIAWRLARCYTSPS